MKKIAKVFFNIACIISCVVAAWHFSVPYSSKWFSYIPDAPTEIIQSINYINFCFSFLLAGISLLLLLVRVFLQHFLKKASKIKGLRAVKQQYLHQKNG